MPLNPFVYRDAIKVVDKRIENHLKPFVNSRPAQTARNIEYWEALTPDEKEYVVKFVEKSQNNSIAKAMMRHQPDIPVPRIGTFTFSNANYYKINNREELNALSKEERKQKIVEYHIAHKRKKRFSIGDGTKISFAKNFAKR